MKRFVSFLIFLSIILTLGEILTRIFIPIDPQKRSVDRTFQHPYIRTDWVPGFKTTYVIDGIGGQSGTMNFEINELGFRSHSMKTMGKPPRTYRIFFVGGSTTEEIYMPEEKTFPFIVERKLKKTNPDLNFECVNDGISGYLAADVLAALIYKVMYYEPDLVVVMLGVNDVRYGAVSNYDPIRRPSYEKVLYKPGYEERMGESIVNILKRSHFLTLIKWRLINRLFPPDAERFKTKLEEYNYFRRQRRQTPITPVTGSKAMADFLKNLQEMIFITQGHGVRLIFMTEPSIYQKNLPREVDEKLWMGFMPEAGLNLSNEFLLKEINRFNDAVRELSKKYGVELLDLERRIPKDLVHFYDDVHLSPEGAKKAAQVISDYLLQQPERLVSSPTS